MCSRLWIKIQKGSFNCLRLVRVEDIRLAQIRPLLLTCRYNVWYLCVRDIDCVSIYDLSIIFYNCSDSVVILLISV